MVTEKISNLLDQYFDLAFEEGREGRFYDTEAGDAQRVRSELEEAIAALSAKVTNVAEGSEPRYAAVVQARDQANTQESRALVREAVRLAAHAPKQDT